MKRKTTEEWIKEAKLKHGDKYDYSKVNYVDKKTEVCIICPIHGEVWMKPVNHINGCGCKKCSIMLRKQNNPYTTEEFIEKARNIHGDKYDYSKVEYVNNHTKVCVICQKHGEFYILPNNHLHGSGCIECGRKQSQNKQTYTTEKFIEKAKKVHGDKYDYSKVEYKRCDEKVCITCPIHGEFWQIASEHLRGSGCQKCGDRKSNTGSFIAKAKSIHGNKYNYSKVDYVNTSTKICIICPKHGEFWQKPNDHLNGCGCPICNESKLENEIKNFLDLNSIEYIRECSFGWLGLLRLDFYLPKYNVAIECQGLQHFKEGCYKHDTLSKRVERDNRKLKLCNENGVKLFYYSNLKIKYPYYVYTDKQKLLEVLIHE